MIIVDEALRRRVADGAPPIAVAMLGAGFMARGIVRQCATAFAGAIRIAGIATRTPARAMEALALDLAADPVECRDRAEIDAALAAGRTPVTADAVALAEADGIDVLLDATGAVEGALRPVLAAIAAGRHVVLMNAELDGTVGPVLKRRADAAGVVYTGADGDQPGVTMNLYRFVRGIGVRPVLCGNIKGLHDPYRNPTTQEAFARRWGQNPAMVTSFADGTKISFEQAVVANATGMEVARRGMFGHAVPAGTPVAEAAALFDPDALVEGPGIVDYVVGAAPAPGVFVLGTTDDPVQRHYLELYKLGPGPLYCFSTPYHLCHFEVPNTVARAVLFGDAALAPRDVPAVDVVAVAKRDLAAGEVLDGLGGYATYGVAENARVALGEGLLPIGLAEGCRLTRAVRRDEVLTLADVERPVGRLVDGLRAEQDRLLAAAAAPGVTERAEALAGG